jgi:prepilin-type N-terminal cleavage/methylation domain-containing protein
MQFGLENVVEAFCRHCAKINPGCIIKICKRGPCGSFYFMECFPFPWYNRKERKQIMTNRRNVAGGVTLVEILVVIALLGILAVVATPSAKTYFANLTLRIATNAIKQQLILAKTRAMGDPNVHCGVYFDSSVTPNQIRPFMDTTTFYQYTGTDLAYMPVYTLPKNVTISVGGTGSSKVIVFRGDGSAKSGVTNNQIIVKITITSKSGTFTKSKTISVLPSTGRIKVQ